MLLWSATAWTITTFDLSHRSKSGRELVLDNGSVTVLAMKMVLSVEKKIGDLSHRKGWSKTSEGGHDE